MNLRSSFCQLRDCNIVTRFAPPDEECIDDTTNKVLEEEKQKRERANLAPWLIPEKVKSPSPEPAASVAVEPPVKLTEAERLHKLLEELDGLCMPEEPQTPVGPKIENLLDPQLIDLDDIFAKLGRVAALSGMLGSALEGHRHGIGAEPLPGREEVLTAGKCGIQNDLHLDFKHLADTHLKFKVVTVDDIELVLENAMSNDKSQKRSTKKRLIAIIDVSGMTRKPVMVNGQRISSAKWTNLQDKDVIEFPEIPDKQGLGNLKFEI